MVRWALRFVIYEFFSKNKKNYVTQDKAADPDAILIFLCRTLLADLIISVYKEYPLRNFSIVVLLLFFAANKEQGNRDIMIFVYII